MPHRLRNTLENSCQSTESTAASRNVTYNCIAQEGSHITTAQKCHGVFWKDALFRQRGIW